MSPNIIEAYTVKLQAVARFIKHSFKGQKFNTRKSQ